MIDIAGRHAGFRAGDHVVYGDCFFRGDELYLETARGIFGPVKDDELVEVLPQYEVVGDVDRIRRLAPELGIKSLHDAASPDGYVYLLNALPQQARELAEKYKLQLIDRHQAV